MRAFDSFTQTKHTHQPAAGTPIPIDLAAVKAKQQSAWGSGDYSVIGTTLTGVDYVPSLLEKARARATGEGLALDLRDGDAEALPFEDGAFDIVLSTFGVMFTPDQPRAARELARVCRHGGRIALASWTPDGFIGRVFKMVGSHVPPPSGVPSPLAWGTEPRLAELFAGEVREIRTRQREFVFRYRSPAHWLEVFRTWYGPIHKAFLSLAPEARPALERDLTTLLEQRNVARDGTLAVPSTYLEAVIVRV